MIRNDRQLLECEEDLKICWDEMSALRKDADLAQDDREYLLSVVRERAMLIAANIREYKALKNVDYKVPVISTSQIETGLPSFTGGLFSMRKSTGLSQVELSQSIGTSQSHIARMENSATENFEVDSVRRWAHGCGFDFTSLFLRPAEYDDPSAIVRLVLEAALIRSCFGRSENAIDAMEVFLSRLAHITEADALTCYLLHPTENRMQLFFTLNLRDDAQMRGRVKSSNVPLLILRRPLGFIADVKDDPATRNSSFAAREGVVSLFHLPFQVNGHSGIAFLNYRRQIKPPSPAYLKSLSELSTALSVIFPQGIGDLLSDNSLQTYSPKQDSINFFSSEMLELLQQFSVDGLNKKSFRSAITIAKKLLSPGCNISSALYEVKGGRLKRLMPDRCDGDFPAEIEMSHSPSTEEDCPSVIEIAAGRNTYLLSDNNQICALPLTVNTTHSQRVVLALKTEAGYQFSIDDAQIIEWIGQYIVAAHAFSEMQSKKSSTVAPIRERVIKLFSTLNPAQGETITDRLQSLAELAIDLFGAVVVDIWPFDWSRSDFSEAGAQATSPEMNMEFDGAKLRPRDRGNSMNIVSLEPTDPQRDTQDNREIASVCFIEDAETDLSVSPYTARLGIRSLVGVPIYGPESARAEGVLWIRFNRVIPPQERPQLYNDVSIFAKFIHLIWEPIAATTKYYKESIGT